MRARYVLPLLVLIAGCGGGDTTTMSTTETRSAPPPPSLPAPRPRDDVAVIREWANRLRRGDVNGASDLWTVPATIQNGGGPEVLDSVELVRIFNETLPCGAKLISTKKDGRRIIATFELTERTGGACGSGVGERASTEFLIERGKIVEWVRVPVPEDQLHISPPVESRPRPGPARPRTRRAAPARRRVHESARTPLPAAAARAARAPLRA
jgi:hypothetical protein